MYKKVSTDMNFAAREKEVLKFWQENDIIRKSFHARDNAEETFTFFSWSSYPIIETTKVYSPCFTDKANFPCSSV